jgi:hypothetical protein
VACFRRSVAAARLASIDDERSIKQTAILTREKAKGYTALVLGLFDLLGLQFFPRPRDVAIELIALRPGVDSSRS